MPTAMAHCRPPITPKASILAIAVASRRSPLDPMREPEAQLPTALVSPGGTFVNRVADLTLQIGASEFCGTKTTLLSCLATIKPAPVAVTLGLTVPTQNRRQAISPKSAQRTNTFNLRLI